MRTAALLWFGLVGTPMEGQGQCGRCVGWETSIEIDMVLDSISFEQRADAIEEDRARHWRDYLDSIRLEGSIGDAIADLEGIREEAEILSAEIMRSLEVEVGEGTGGTLIGLIGAVVRWGAVQAGSVLGIPPPVIAGAVAGLQTLLTGGDLEDVVGTMTVGAVSAWGKAEVAKALGVVPGADESILQELFSPPSDAELTANLFSNLIDLGAAEVLQWISSGTVGSLEEAALPVARQRRAGYGGSIGRGARPLLPSGADQLRDEIAVSQPRYGAITPTPFLTMIEVGIRLDGEDWARRADRIQHTRVESLHRALGLQAQELDLARLRETLVEETLRLRALTDEFVVVVANRSVRDRTGGAGAALFGMLGEYVGSKYGGPLLGSAMGGGFQAAAAGGDPGEILSASGRNAAYTVGSSVLRRALAWLDGRPDARSGPVGDASSAAPESSQPEASLGEHETNAGGSGATPMTGASAFTGPSIEQNDAIHGAAFERRRLEAEMHRLERVDPPIQPTWDPISLGVGAAGAATLRWGARAVTRVNWKNLFVQVVCVASVGGSTTAAVTGDKKLPLAGQVVRDLRNLDSRRRRAGLPRTRVCR